MAVMMFHPFKNKFVEKAIKYFAKDLRVETQGGIKQYGGDLDIEDRGITIGGYESARLTDLCMAYVMDNSPYL
jgi:hypothetical protein